MWVVAEKIDYTDGLRPRVTEMFILMYLSGSINE